MTLRQLPAWTDSQIETLYPGCFALVMATGIVSNAVFLEGSRALRPNVRRQRLGLFRLGNLYGVACLSVPSNAMARSDKSTSDIFVPYGCNMPFLRTMLPFIDGATFMMWAWASMWIPLLVLLGIWKHGVRAGSHNLYAAARCIPSLV